MGSPTPTGSRTPSFLVGVGEGGAPPPSPCPIQTRGEGRATQPLPPLLFSTKARRPIKPLGGSGNLPVLR